MYMYTQWNEKINNMESAVGLKSCYTFQLKCADCKKAWKSKNILAVKSRPACAFSKSLLFQVTRQWLWFPSPSTISPVELLTSGIEYKKKLGWIITMSLWMEQPLCMLWKPYNIPIWDGSAYNIPIWDGSTPPVVSKVQQDFHLCLPSTLDC